MNETKTTVKTDNATFEMIVCRDTDGDTLTIRFGDYEIIDVEDLQPYDGVPEDKHEAMAHVFRLFVQALVECNANTFDHLENAIHDALKSFAYVK